MRLTAEEQRQFREATHCWICDGPNYDDEDLVRDHCHYTGEYRGPAHNK